MTKYAQFDSTASGPTSVLGWYDTGEFTYPKLPASTDLLPLTDAQWAARLTGNWGVSAGALISYTPPTPTPTVAQQAQAAFSAGLAITSAANSALDATYSVSAEMQANLVALDGYYAKFNTFPNKSATVTIPDIKGKGHVFTYAEFETLFQTLGDYRAALVECANGTSTTLPDPSNYGNIP